MSIVHKEEDELGSKLLTYKSKIIAYVYIYKPLPLLITHLIK